ncbi:reticulon-2a isoform X1 [Pimephales promelas]|uniref:reticulon-2a isoform X1 n=1 Tax=Pimephales promelas TaxID=90988 RepID=UPI0019556BE1|nr:reticulon-2a isoform X1 [Pimephales promelas]KAG1951233.1 reticulon-2 isoform B [Pimephales promelas]KAG1951234.1 reticulon-2 isoform B [Pimephales promelas]
MGQVLGFSHCKEFGTVNSTPDSTPSCSDGGNEESDFPELQTAREWSDDEEGLEDDDACLSSSSIWGTPRQNSFELTFSYIAFSESDGSSRRDSGRRRTGGRGSRGSLHRTDTLETQVLPDSPAVEWDPHDYLTEGDVEEEGLTWTLEPRSHRVEEFQDKDTWTWEPTEEISGIQTHNETCSHQNEQITVPQLHGSDPSVATETTATLQMVDPSHTTPPAIGHNTQEEQICKQWCSALNLSEGPTIRIHIAVMDLIYWKDMERTGMIFTGLVVGLLALFQLSIITVVSTLSLAIICFTISVRIYYKLLHVLQLGDGAHPFQSYLDLDIGLSGEEAQHYVQRAIVLSCSAVDTLRNLIFVGNLFNSLKFLLLMYLVTFLGSLCNGLTLLIIGVIAVFSVPLFYTRHQDKVDSCIVAVLARVDNIKDFLHRLAQGGGPPLDPTPGGAKPKAH